MSQSVPDHKPCVRLQDQRFVRSANSHPLIGGSCYLILCQTFACCCRRICELVVACVFGLVLTEQYVFPAIVNSYGAFNELRYLQAFERLLKLSVPTLWGWLVVFYTLFHLLLNITAEFTRFGDREFYLVSA